jgi:hypothetical protein
VKAKAREGAAGLGGIAGQIDALGIAFDAGLIAPPHVVTQVAHLVHPAALVARADRWFRLRPPSPRKQRQGPTATTTATTTIMTTAKGKEQREKAKRMRDSSFYCGGSK